MNFYTDFDSYVADHPEGEGYRTWLTMGQLGIPLHGPVKKGKRNAGFELRQAPIRLIKGTGAQCTIDGGYLIATLGVRADDWRAGYGAGWSFYVYVNDCDDFGICKGHLTWDEALAELDALCVLSPLDMHDLIEAFDYEMN